MVEGVLRERGEKTCKLIYLFNVTLTDLIKRRYQYKILYKLIFTLLFVKIQIMIVLKYAQECFKVLLKL